MSTSLHDENVLHFLSDLPLILAAEHDIRGKAIHDASGKAIGVARELVVSHDSGRVVFVEVDCKTLLGARKFLIPVEELVNRGGKISVRGAEGCSDETPWHCPELKAQSPA